jgi:hypothetical protein
MGDPRKLLDNLTGWSDDLVKATYKIAGAWGLWFYQNVSTQKIATLVAIVYTSLQLYILLRDKIFGNKKD